MSIPKEPGKPSSEMIHQPPHRYNVGIIEEDVQYRHDLVLNMARHDQLAVCLHTATTDAAQSFMQLQPHLLLIGMPPWQHQMMENIRQLKAQHPSMLLVIIAEEENPELIQKAFDKGADGYVLKTDHFQNIANKLVHMIEYDQPVMSQQLFRYMLYKNRLEKSPPKANLTRKEKEITDLVLEGLPYKEIAAKMSLSLNTVQYHMKNIFVKLQVRTKAELFKIYYQ
jgi:DNA-binding NarL/FixJ family response regulator